MTPAQLSALKSVALADPVAAGYLNVADAAVRASLDDLCGSQNILKGFVQAACKRSASRAEKALATGTGTDAAPATLGYEGVISGNDASLIREAA